VISLGLGYVYGKWRQGSGQENTGNAEGTKETPLKEPEFLEQGLVAYYPFNGNANDESGNGDVNSATLTEDRHGKKESAYSFDAVDDYIQITNSPNLNSSTATISAWYKATMSFKGLGHNPIIQKPFTSHTAPHFQWSLYVKGDRYGPDVGNFWFGFQSQTMVCAHKSLIPKKALNNWIHLVGVVNEAKEECLFYFNGQLVSEINFGTNKSPAYETDIYIGRLGNIVNSWSHTPGVIDNVRIYNRALSEAEVKELYEFEKAK
jgi:hypothetical protein